MVSNLLYKYLDVNEAKMMLQSSNLMYANATTFNDPFDCHPSLIDFSDVPGSVCGNWSEELVSGLSINKYENIRNNLWICCLSKLYNSILMWSYYNKHEGVCIGLNMDNVAKCIDIRYGMMVCSSGKEVQYKDVVDKANYYRDREDFFNYQVYTKAKAWEHEQEVRLFIYKPSAMYMGLLPFQRDKYGFDNKEIRAFVPITPECFESIYLGVKIDTGVKKDIIKLAKNLNPDIKIYQMHVDSSSFSVVEKNLND